MNVTMKDIAALCGVSKSLVSRIINHDPTLRIPNETRAKVLDAVEQTGYVRDVNAQALAGGRNRAPVRRRRIGYITYTSINHLGHPYFSSVLDGVTAALAKSGCDLALEVTVNEFNSRQQALCEEFSGDNQLDGIILLGEIELPEIKKVIRSIARYVVCLGPFDSRSDIVEVNLNSSIQLAIEHVLDLGYTDIGLLHSANHPARLKWCHYVMELRDEAFNPDWVIDGAYAIQTAYQEVQDRLQAGLKPPRCMVAWNDEMALGCIKALTTAGYKVPEDVAVTGHDDIAIAAYVDIPLTTVHVYKEELGELAVQILLGRMDTGRKIPIKVEMAGRLIKRESCGRHLPRGDAKVIPLEVG